MNLFTIAFGILLTLKLLGLFTHSWWVVFSPLIIGFVVSFAVIFIALLNKEKHSYKR